MDITSFQRAAALRGRTTVVREVTSRHTAKNWILRQALESQFEGVEVLVDAASGNPIYTHGIDPMDDPYLVR